MGRGIDRNRMEFKGGQALELLADAGFVKVETEWNLETQCASSVLSPYSV